MTTTARLHFASAGAVRTRHYDDTVRERLNVHLEGAGFPPLPSTSLDARLLAEQIEQDLFVGQDNYEGWTDSFRHRLAVMIDERMREPK